MAPPRKKATYIPDPGRRAYHQALRTIRMQVYREHEKEISETGFLGRVFLRLRIEREIRERSKNLKFPPRR